MVAAGCFCHHAGWPGLGHDPSLYMQLAISKQGVISGTLKNTLTGKTQSLEGMADKKSQRVAWVRLRSRPADHGDRAFQPDARRVARP